jgi:hypothetical protein
MSGEDPNRALEARGVELARQGQYAEARGLFEQVLPNKADPLHRAQVLRNIGLSYEREGNKVEAIRVYQQILEVPGLWDTNEGVSLHGQITGHVNRLQGRSVWSGVNVGVYALFASTPLGALIGGQMSHHTPIGIALGAVVGFFLALPVTRIFVAGTTSMFRFTPNEERNREVFDQYVIPTAKVLLFLTGVGSIVALLLGR